MGKFNTLFKCNIAAQDVYGRLITLYRKATVRGWRQLINNNRKLRDFKKTDRCFVIGLGPSLKDVDLSKITDDSIVVNRFNVFDEGKFSPTFYMLSDSAFFVEPLNELLEPMYNTYPNTKFIFDGMFYKEIKKKIPEDSRVFYTFSGNGVFNHKRAIDYTEWSSVKYNVVAGAIAMAMYLGYSEIVLLGCDFNSFASPKAIHCYKEKNDTRLISLSFELFCYSFAAYAHNELSEYAEQHGVRIVNATKGSLIDAYEKADLEEFLCREIIVEARKE